MGGRSSAPNPSLEDQAPCKKSNYPVAAAEYQSLARRYRGPQSIGVTAMKTTGPPIRDYWNVRLSWMKPRPVEGAVVDDLPDRAHDSYGIYRFERRHHRSASSSPTIV